MKRFLGFPLTFAIFFCWCDLDANSFAADSSEANIVLNPSGVVTVDHMLVLCDTGPATTTFALVDQFVAAPGEQASLPAEFYTAGPADIFFDLGKPIVSLGPHCKPPGGSFFSVRYCYLCEASARQKISAP